MKSISEVLRYIIISPEFLVVLVIVFLIYNHLSLLDAIGVTLSKDSEVIKYLPSLPISLTIYASHVGAKILRPRETESNKILYEWPGYWRLKSRVIASIVICGASSASALITWIFQNQLTPVYIGAAILTSVILPIVSVFILYMAWLTIREYFET